jgi:tetratricopeptide (TPR) repeat protein
MTDRSERTSQAVVHIIMSKSRYHINKLWLEDGGQYYACSIYLHKAEILELVGEWQEAERLYREIGQFALNARAKKQIADSEIKLFRIMRYMGKAQDPLAALSKALALYTELDDQSGISQAINNIGLVHMLHGRHQKAEEYFMELISRAKKHNDSKHLISGLGNISQLHINRGQFDRALDCLKQCADVSMAENEMGFLIISYGTIGNVYFYQKEFDQAYQYYRKQLELAQRLGDLANKSVAVGNIGNIFYRQSKFKEAVDCYQTKLEISQKLDYKIGIYQSYGNMGLVYADQGRYQDAMDCFKKMLEVSEIAADPEGREGGYSGMGLVYTKTGEYARARECFLRVVEIDLETGLTKELSSNYCQLAEACFMNGDSAETVEYLGKAILTARESNDDEVLTKTEILGAKLAALTDRVRAEKMLLDILEKQPEKSVEALVCYEIFVINGKAEHRARAMMLFQELYDQTYDYDYKRMMTELEKTADKKGQ